LVDGFVQGYTVAVVSSLDLLAIISGHAKMNGLRTAAITTFHQTETGAPAGIARIVQAATAPNEGQRFLQGELHVGAMEGESREQTSTSTDAAGNMHTERLAERSVVLEDGRSVHVQQSQQVVAPVFDQALFTAAMSDVVSASVKEQMAASVKGELAVVLAKCTRMNDATMLHVDTVVQKEGAARELALQKEGEAREQAFLALELKNSALEKRLTDLEQGGTSSNKKPRKADKIIIKQRKNIISWTLNGATVFGWSKMVQGETRTKKGFSSAEAAMLDMDRFYAAAGHYRQ